MRKMVKNWRVWLGFLILIPSLLLNYYLWQKTAGSESGSLVVNVLDGDTFVLETSQRVRLAGLNAPEVDFCGGQEAKEKLESLVMEKRVILREPVVDNWGRIIALVYVGNQFINEEVLKEGWGYYTSDKNSQREVLKTTAHLAQEEEKGVFSPRCYQKENPEDPDCQIKGNIDKNSGDKIYHFPGCRQYEQTIVEKSLGEQWFCTEKEALKAGFKKSKNCD
ncbi:MAG TPA: thermonuclease family protein [Patescibacteria group bacterium]|nr:thermonuclease family protein [Patescibacteria group bacterium]